MILEKKKKVHLENLFCPTCFTDDLKKQNKTRQNISFHLFLTLKHLDHQKEIFSHLGLGFRIYIYIYDLLQKLLWQQLSVKGKQTQERAHPWCEAMNTN